MKLVVGLGNPGKEYEKTRHNVGFLVLDSFLGNVDWKKEIDCFSYTTVVRQEKVMFIKPTTYMNLSGNCVRRIANYYKVLPEDIMVIHDDMDIPKMTYRLKFDSSSGGHNGIKNIINMLGTQKFFRLKIGVGKSSDIPTVDFVLSKLSKEELEGLKDLKYSKIIDSFINNGYQFTMDNFR